MHKVIVNIDTEEHAELFIKMAEQLNYVSSVEKGDEGRYNWINPTRPATDEECEQMIREAEEEYRSGNFISADEARSISFELINQWKTKKQK